MKLGLNSSRRPPTSSKERWRAFTKVPGAGGGSIVQTIDHDSLKRVLSGSLETILRFGSLTIDEVTDVRRMLEVPAARLAAEHRAEGQAAELSALIERQEEPCSTPSAAMGDGDRRARPA